MFGNATPRLCTHALLQSRRACCCKWSTALRTDVSPRRACRYPVYIRGRLDTINRYLVPTTPGSLFSESSMGVLFNFPFEYGRSLQLHSSGHGPFDARRWSGCITLLIADHEELVRWQLHAAGVLFSRQVLPHLRVQVSTPDPRCAPQDRDKGQGKLLTL